MKWCFSGLGQCRSRELGAEQARPARLHGQGGRGAPDAALGFVWEPQPCRGSQDWGVPHTALTTLPPALSLLLALLSKVCTGI